MAASLKQLQSWLPTEFFTTEQLLMEQDNFDKNEFNSVFSFPTEFPYEFDSFGSSSSSLNSPDESVVGSNETESGEDDDFLAGLTHRLTQQLTVKPEKQWVMAGSPESTLSGIGSWSVSSSGSPNGVLSPPTTPFGAKNDTWDLIYAAAGEVARLKMRNEGNKYNNHQERGLFASAKGQQNQNIGFFSSQNPNQSVSQLNQYRSQVKQEQVLKPRCGSVWGRQQQVKDAWPAPPQPHHHHSAQPQAPSHYHHQQQQIQSRNRAIAGYDNGRSVRPLGLPQSAWPPLEVHSDNQHRHHQQSGAGMRAVFLGGSGVKRGCAGTGVFLPRRYGNQIDSKKKSACSTVLLPAKVVQALNLNLEEMNVNTQTQNAFPSDYEVMIARRNAILAQQRRNLRHESVLNHEVGLPQEWTY